MSIKRYHGQWYRKTANGWTMVKTLKEAING